MTMTLTMSQSILDSHIMSHVVHEQTPVCVDRFCTECKSKVLRAYSILMGDLDTSKEKGYCPSLYDGLRCCPGERHLHIECETDFVAHLIARAEPDLSGR